MFIKGMDWEYVIQQTLSVAILMVILYVTYNKLINTEKEYKSYRKLSEERYLDSEKDKAELGQKLIEIIMTQNASNEKNNENSNDLKEHLRLINETLEKIKEKLYGGR